MEIRKKFLEKISLSRHSEFRIGGPAKYFFTAQNKSELIESLRWAKENSEKVFLLGGGSNVLFSDRGFDGLVIKYRASNISGEEKGEKLIVVCEPGLLLGKLILEVAGRGYKGIEWGFGIPGTVGGAIFGNAGRLGRDISEVVVEITILNGHLEEEVLPKEKCEFSYRNSRFKKNGEIILEAKLEFEKCPAEEIEKGLNEAKKIAAGAPRFPSAGCVFKNYIVGENDKLLKNHPDLAGRIRGGKIGAGFFIDQCRLKGKRVGDIVVWENHANYFINIGKGKSEDVVRLAEICKQSVREKFGIELEEEIRIIEY